MGIGQPDPLFIVAAICERMGWTYDDYMNAPDCFVTVIAVKIDSESRVQQQREREISRKSMRGR